MQKIKGNHDNSVSSKIQLSGNKENMQAVEHEPLREQHVLTQHNFDECSLTYAFFHLQ